MSCELVLMGRLARFQSNGAVGLEDDAGTVFRGGLLSEISEETTTALWGRSKCEPVRVVDRPVSGQRGRLGTEPLFRVKPEKGAFRHPEVQAWAVGRLSVPPMDTGKEDWVGKGEPG